MTLFERVEVVKEEELQSRLEVDTYRGRLQLQRRLCRMTEDSRKSEDRERVLHGEVRLDVFRSPWMYKNTRSDNAIKHRKYILLFNILFTYDLFKIIYTGVQGVGGHLPPGFWAHFTKCTYLSF